MYKDAGVSDITYRLYEDDRHEIFKRDRPRSGHGGYCGLAERACGTVILPDRFLKFI